jgi:tetrahydromethanopterin S-methyltransferase subunit E
MAKKKVAAKKTINHPVHHKVAKHLDRPVNSIFGYTVILLFLVVTLAVLMSFV